MYELNLTRHVQEALLRQKVEQQQQPGYSKRFSQASKSHDDYKLNDYSSVDHLSPSPRLRPCVAWQGSKERGGHPEKYSSTQLRRLCPGDVRASGGSVLLVPMITLCTGDLEECVRAASP